MREARYAASAQATLAAEARDRTDSGAVDERAREVEGDAYVGERVLDRLVAADLAAELLALLHVGDGVGQDPLARAEQLRGGGQHGQVEGLRVGRPFALDLEQATGAIDDLRASPTLVASVLPT